MSNVYDNWERLVEAVLHEERLRREALRDFSRLSLSSFSSSSSSLFRREGYQKPGKAIFKGHKNYALILNLQDGIRYSVGKIAPVGFREVRMSDFDTKAKLWARFQPRGSKYTPPSRSGEFLWEDYRPMVFRNLREMFKVDSADYMMAICGDDVLREVSSPGKSGSFFYLTQDDRFMIKRVKKSELQVLIKMLPHYYHHIAQHENSLLTKFYGAHCIEQGGVKSRFIVMDNLFCSEYQIHRRFDLKGSSLGRSVEGEIDEITTFKDLDLNFVFQLQPNWYQMLMKQIVLDCQFLEAVAIMDYSLLVGVHFCDNSKDGAMGLLPFLQTGNRDSYQNEMFKHGFSFSEAEQQDMDHISEVEQQDSDHISEAEQQDSDHISEAEQQDIDHISEAEQQDIDHIIAGQKPSIRLGLNMPARAERIAEISDFDQSTSRSGGVYEVVLYFGIVGILQDYDISKKLENAYKSIQFDAASISAVDPKFYSERFREFMGRVFVEDKL